jgi:hypothetical protein
VTGISYSDNAVVNGTTYQYYVTTLYSDPSGESAPSNLAEATPQDMAYAEIGSGTGITPDTEGCPINIYKKSLHGQSVYTAAELNAAGLYGPTEITHLGFYVSTAPALALPNFRVRIKHTAAADASAWITADGLVTVYSNAAYLPAAGNWDLLSLSAPFAWNGIDNIVIDTAFDRVATESATGTVRYTNVASGYRYGRSTYSDMGETFTGGLVSAYRPNVKLGFAYVEPAGPEIAVDPLSLDFGAVEVGQSSVLPFTIYSNGDETLIGDISTPTGFSVAAAGSKDDGAGLRNTLSFTLPVGTYQTYNLSFNPTAVATYAGNVTITSNDLDEGTVLLAVTGQGYTPANISLSDNSLGATLFNGGEGTDSFTVSNSGSQDLSFSLAESPSVAWFSAAPASGNVSGSGSQLITGTFSPEGLAPGTYTTTLLVNSNDPDSPQLPVSVQLVVQNSSPVISLPASLTFDIYADAVLVEDFSAHVSDADPQSLSLSCSGNTNIQVDIAGLIVTFSSIDHWVGSEELTFTVFDGFAQAADALTVTITQTMYPPTNLSATAGNSLVNLSWTAPAPTGVAGYRIHRNGSFLADVTGTSYTDESAINGFTYGYYVTTLYANPSGESDPSNTAEATPQAIINVTLGDGTSATGTNDGCPINVFRRSLHGQSVYTAAELNAAGVYGPVEITALGFYVNSAPNLALPSFVVRMKHTTAANVASWQTSTGMVTVYSAASHMPSPGGYDMLTLSNPFTWNGTDNLVIDTAFDRVSSSSSSGTVRYTETASGYRYARSNISNQTNVFTGGSVSVYRPNVQLTLAGGTDAPPEITVDPLQLAFGELEVGSSQVQQFSLANTGEMELTGSISTPAGYSVAPLGRSSEVSGLRQKSVAAGRNTLEFNIAGYSSVFYNLTFQPTEAIAYNGNLEISSNDDDEPTVNIALSGTGQISNTEPTIVLPESFNFEEDGSLTVDFAPYVEDAQTPDSGLTLGYSGNTDVTVSIDGLSVTFGATGNWNGTETITFTIGDGELTASDAADVIVLPVNDTPTIALPESFSFDMNQNLPVDFTAYVNDVDGQELALGYEGNTNVLVAIDGLNVTFTAVEDWHGSEEISFSVFDGYDYAYDTVTVTVNFVNHAPTLTLPLEGFQFNLNQSLSVDFGPYIEDLDGHTVTLTVGESAYIQAAIDGHQVTFSAPADWFGSETLNFVVDDGYAIGYASVEVRVILILAIPDIAVSKSAGGVTVSWDAVTNANRYHIYRATAPYGDYGTLPFATVLAPNTSWEDTAALPMAFYKVVAAFEDLPAKQ